MKLKTRKRSLQNIARNNRLPEVCVVHELFESRFGGRTWSFGTAKLRRHGHRGLCMTYKKKLGRSFVLISTHLRRGSPMLLTAIIHETLHALLPEASEQKVEQTATRLARVIRRFGEHGLA